MSLFTKLILSSGTVGNPALDDLVAAALAGRYDGVVVWPHDLRRWDADGVTLADARQRFDDAGLAVEQLDALIYWTAVGSTRAVEEEHTLLGAVETLGARYITAILPAAQPEAELIDALVPLGRRAAEVGAVIALEPSPWKGNVSLAAALRIVTEAGPRVTAGQPAGAAVGAGLVVDNWHMARGGVPLEELTDLPAENVLAVQISDAPVTAADDLVKETMEERLLPGEGELNLAGFVTALAAGGVSAGLTVEVLSKALLDLGPVAAAVAAADATRAALTKAAATPDS
jgi:sugar phosphate isomerase/epimerase